MRASELVIYDLEGHCLFFAPEQLAEERAVQQITQGFALINLLNRAMGETSFARLIIFNPDQN